ncbi:vascular endothelial growth factor A-A-like isoform X2 [Diachasmimorpha longicaudata]|uniref:vascular endothelial growth factor A-A-like isoform X2 n=1 Tax=Diachasmimorpha longicaudata TaxID=58733 RepID=UPI0030B891E6
MKLIVVLVICGTVFGHHQIFYGDPGDIVFDGPVDDPRKPPTSSRANGEEINQQSSLARSIALARKLSNINSLDEFLNMVGGAPDESDIGMASRFGGEERSNLSPVVMANCKAELQPVRVPKDANDHSVVYHPYCIKIKRCSGCCSHPLLTCRAVKNETRNFEIFVAKITEDGSLGHQYKEIVTLEEHTKCQCQCKTLAEHCTEKQDYIAGECSCRCRNSDEKIKCLNNNKTKLWDPDSCVCLCRNTQECNTGFFFDQNTCRCDDEAMIFL